MTKLVITLHLVLSAFLLFTRLTELEPYPAVVKTKPTVFYSQPRKDRSGAFLQDMLFAHAHAFSRNYTYGGCCELEGETAPHHDIVQTIINSLGLQDILRFACPTSSNEDTPILAREEYYDQDTLVWSKEWLSYIHGLVRHDNTVTKQPMAVHIRRGDVEPCPDQDRRYLPNQHYLRLIEKYLPNPDTPVYIYSESNSTESWNDFLNDANFHLELDTPVESVFLALATAEILVMSKSSFSLVPAMLNPNKVIYTPFWHEPLPNWTVIPSELVYKANLDIMRLRRSHGC